MQGTPAVLLVRTGEVHELSHTAPPSHRPARCGAILDLWARHLGTGR